MDTSQDYINLPQYHPFDFSSSHHTPFFPRHSKPPSEISTTRRHPPIICPRRSSAPSRLFSRNHGPHPSQLGPRPSGSYLPPEYTPNPAPPFDRAPPSHLNFTPTPQPSPARPFLTREERERTYTKAGYHPTTEVSLERVDPESVVVGRWEGVAVTPQLEPRLGLRGGAAGEGSGCGSFGEWWVGGGLPEAVWGDGGGWNGEAGWDGHWSVGLGELGDWGELDEGWWLDGWGWDLEGREEGGWQSRLYSGEGEGELVRNEGVRMKERRAEGAKVRKKTLKREKKTGVLSATVLVLTVDYGSEWMRECAAYYNGVC